MKLCPNCISDNIERTSSTGIRVVICLVLLFIPFGLLICWIPFAFPHTFRCNHCSAEGKEEELLAIDWRERETFLEKERLMKEGMIPLLDKWFESAEKFYKIKKRKNQFLLLEVDTYVTPFKLRDYEPNQLHVGPDQLNIQVLDYNLNEKRYEPTKEGKELFTEGELAFISQRDKKRLKEYLSQNNLLIDPFEVNKGNR